MAALATPAPVTLAVFEFELEDTTAASVGASAASDASHLAEVTGGVREALGQSGRYRIVDVGREAATAGALRDCGGCEAAIAKGLGADQSLIGVVRRVSRTEYTLGFGFAMPAPARCWRAATAACARVQTIRSAAPCGWSRTG